MQKITISMVEDLPEVLDSIRKLIQQSEKFLWVQGYTNGEQSIMSIPSNPVDILIMDINLPGMNGISCMQEIRRINPEIQFLMYTIFEEDEKVFEALKAGAHGYLVKKTPKEKILESLEELYNGGAPMNAHIARRVISFFDKESDKKTELLLTQKENQILKLLSRGYLYKEIANDLKISLNTVKQHIHHIYEKLHVQNRTEAINKLHGKS
jgi:DNA-binding NarL/FixJ family response regulator